MIDGVLMTSISGSRRMGAQKMEEGSYTQEESARDDNMLGQKK
jgi:hypothetical protein